ncbi:MAG: beta-Ig-H3/fasciclin [Mastigocladus sp. ERB_26_2]
MNKKLLFLASTVGISILIGACEPATQTPTTTPPDGSPPPAYTPPAGVPPATPTVTPTTP